MIRPSIYTYTVRTCTYTYIHTYIDDILSVKYSILTGGEGVEDDSGGVELSVFVDVERSYESEDQAAGTGSQELRAHACKKH